MMQLKRSDIKRENKRIITYREAVREALYSALAGDDRIIIMGEDVGVYQGVNGVTGNLIDIFGPDRVIDTPISETGFMGAAVGAAIMGLKPIVELQVIDFISVCFDALLNQSAKIRYMSGGQVSVPLVLRAAYGGGLGAAAQHSQSLEAFFAHIPGIKVVLPATPYDAKGLLTAAIKDPDPVVFLEPRALYNAEGSVPEQDYQIEIGIADLKRVGGDLTLITYGQMLSPSMRVAEDLAKEYGTEIEVLDIRSIQPLDRNLILQSVAKTKRVLIVHEAVEFAGFGAEIAAEIAATDLIYELKSPIVRVAAKFSPVPFSRALEEEVLPNYQDIRQAILEMFGLSS